MLACDKYSFEEGLHEYPFQSKLSLGLQWHFLSMRIFSSVGQWVNGT